MTINLANQTEGFTVLGSGFGDMLTGGSGNDVITGGLGNDFLTGGSGVDILTGGSDSDTFVLTATGQSGATATTRDQITDFASAAANGLVHDVINLSGIDAVQGGQDNAFSFNATAWNGVGNEFTAAGQLRYQYFFDANNVEHTIIAGNVNNNLAADFQIDLVGHIVLTTGDFIL